MLRQIEGWIMVSTTRKISIKTEPRAKSSKSHKKLSKKGLKRKVEHKLGEWQATGICGNDITSSCLYVAAIATIYAGALSPLVLLMVGGLLFLYKSIYAEVGDALPLNGGAYNCLLNTTTKFKASIAACMTILSYLATAVISAKTAAEYMSSLIPSMPVVVATIGILSVFAVLTIIGITESAKVALGIFIFNIVTLISLIFLGAYSLITHPEIFLSNWHLPNEDGVLKALFFGFSAGLLGVSGFESSANFIEEQADGVFPKTLRNMWVAVTVLNPLIALTALAILPIDSIVHAQKSLLAEVAMVGGGNILSTIVVINAITVLSGAVLTSFVGSSGLIGRMTLDRCLPQFLLATNKRGTHHWIILSFLFLSSSILIMTGGDLLVLAGVYTISFLGVMCLFAIGNGLLKVRRDQLPRRYRASWLAIFLALIATIAGIAGNIMLKPENLKYFLYYFLPTMALVGLMLARHQILQFILLLINEISKTVQSFNDKLKYNVERNLDDLNSHDIIFFTKGESKATLNEAMLYVQKNEITKHITVIHVYQDKNTIPKNLEEDLHLLDEIYPEVQIDFVLIKGQFGPEMIDELSKKYHIPKNYMFIGAPSKRFPHRLADLGGVRLII
ncbi:APC family permease [bacterium]|nr:APC family permease [bacterium]